MIINKSKRVSSMVANEISELAIKQLSYNEMHDYQEHYKALVLGYGESDLKIYSTIKFEEYQPFIEWLPWLNANKNKVIPLLVSNMLKRDIFAFRIYEILERNENPDDLYLTHPEIQNNPELYDLYKKMGIDTPAAAYVNAVHWLTSEEAATIANEIEQHDHSSHAVENLCTANSLMGISNTHIDCSAM